MLEPDDRQPLAEAGEGRSLPSLGEGGSVEKDFRLLLESVPDCAICLFDPGGRMLGCNEAAERLKGGRADELRGLHFSSFYPPDEVAGGRPARMLEVAARQGRFREDGQHIRRDGSSFWASVELTALLDGAGQVRGFAELTRDATERWHAEERVRAALHDEARRTQEGFAARSRLLSESSRAFANAHPEQALKAMAERLAQEVGDGCVIAFFSGEGRPRPAAVAHRKPEGRRRLQAWAEDGCGLTSDPVAQVYRTGVPLRFSLAEAGASARALCEELGAGSLLLVSLRARGCDLGLLCLSRAEGGHGYAPEDQELIQQLADLAALSLHGARLEAEAQAARAEAEAERSRYRLLSEASNQQRWLEQLLGAMPTPLVLVERGTARVSFANAAADQLAGGRFPRPGSLADYRRDLHCTGADGEELPEERQPCVRAVQGEVLQGVQANWRLPLGGSRAVILSSQLLPAGYGHGATVVLAFDDISELKGVQAALQDAVQLRDTFLSIAGHELKTPLTALQLQLQSLGRMVLGSEIGPAAERMARKIEAAGRQTERLALLIGQLLDVSRLTAGRLTLDVQPVDLAALVREVCARFEEEAERVGCTLVAHAAGRWVGRWDRERVDQVLTNLISNALKYGRGLPVEVHLEGDEQSARLVVRDRGIGIATEDQERIFQRFERAVSDRNYGGLGLGLWIAREMVHAMGGSIQVSSSPDEGSTFTVELPLRDAR